MTTTSAALRFHQRNRAYYDDLERLVVSSLTAPVVGHTVIYGLSDNTVRWWDNTPAAHIGYRPQDSSDVFRAAVEARQPPLVMSPPQW